VRPVADHAHTPTLPKAIKARNPGVTTRSGLSVGPLESDAEIIEVMHDLRAHEVEMRTSRHMRPVCRNRQELSRPVDGRLVGHCRRSEFWKRSFVPIRQIGKAAAQRLNSPGLRGFMRKVRCDGGFGITGLTCNV